MEIIVPREFEPLFGDDWREAAIWGGRYSLKSHTVARYLLIRARQAQTRILCAREFQNSIADSSHQLLTDLIQQYQLTDFVVTDKAITNTVTGSDFIFKGLRHNEQSVKSIEGIDIAWVEEAQTITQSSIEILTPTVRKDGSKIIFTYNRLLEADPVHQRLVIEGRPKTLKINANYDIAERHGWLPGVIKQEIEDDRLNRPELYRHKWLGEPVSSEGKIYRDWAQIDEIPHEAHFLGRGGDFGFDPDPAAVVDIYYYNGGYILDEVLYRKRLLNNELASVLKQKDCLNVFDGAEKKSIAELKSYGVDVVAADKAGGSLEAGIRVVQQMKISVTRSSQNLWREYQTYLLKQDRTGAWLRHPIDYDNHLMDAARYGLVFFAKGSSPDRFADMKKEALMAGRAYRSSQVQRYGV